ncbi:hypothetical protein [Pseudoduganella armeniaca]|uniref:Outer membrane protein assembly factor BamE n=1 Tax=Pseudoduganella armeniaca TaxID=2072590 RepID=A0A2R4CDS0_9BURK|nr:hypothetical protein [Pseudoduganella armeniaca]AVR97769.1 hypothetical protein C9I28_20630 [Pseudoduganella armeniaca]
MRRPSLARWPGRLLLASAMGLGLAGCASAPALTEAQSRQALTAGVSTKADVAQVLGSAKVNAFDSGYEVWTYRYKAGLPVFAGFLPVVGTLATLADATTRERELAILFDPSGVVRKYTLREAPSSAERLVGAR